MNYFDILPHIFIVKGKHKAITYNYLYNTISYLPIDICNFIMSYARIEGVNFSHEEIEIINYLKNKKILTNKLVYKKLKKIDLNYYSPEHIKNMVIELAEVNCHANYTIYNWINTLLVKFIEIRIIDNIDLKHLKQLIDKL